MGIHFLKYLSNILQVFAIVIWSGSLFMIVFILFPQLRKSNDKKILTNQFFIEAINKLEYSFIFGIIFLWSGILIHLITASINPLKSKLYILYICLSALLSFFTLLKIFWIQHSIIKSEKSMKLFLQEELQTEIERRIESYKNAYYFISIVNLLIITVIIFIKQY
ncbi:MAG: hypothetical protein N3F03_05545 [Ignavibacteria bacterium]|nr:hypothetical protein [Ignavibacteria bacterium]